MFEKITITVDLNEDQKKKMPTSGPEEMNAIDTHADVIHNEIDGLLDEIQVVLKSRGYIVDIDY